MKPCFWDALIVEAALAAGADTLLTEDLQHGREIEGLRVHNPFLPSEYSRHATGGPATALLRPL